MPIGFNNGAEQERDVLPREITHAKRAQQLQTEKLCAPTGGRPSQEGPVMAGDKCCAPTGGRPCREGSTMAEEPTAAVLQREVPMREGLSNGYNVEQSRF